MTALPPLPSILSLPPSPKSTSAPEPPLIVFAPPVPTFVAGRPRQVGVAVPWTTSSARSMYSACPWFEVMVKRTYRTAFRSEMGTWLSWCAWPSVNEPVFTTAHDPLAPVFEVSTLYPWAEAKSGSPHTAPGSTTKPLTSTYAGSFTVIERAPVGAMVGLIVDQPVEVDWSIACTGPQP